MSSLSDIIESFIKELMKSNQSSNIEIQRNMLAQQFDCSPSQINYVLTTRFNNEKGYIIESRRGGGGSIKIYKVETSKNNDLEKILNESIGDSITVNKAFDLIDVLHEKRIITQREQTIIKMMLSERALSVLNQLERNKLRADMLKEIILAIIKSTN